MKNILVAGATGYLGKHMVRELKQQGYDVRALARARSGLAPVASLVDDVVEGRITEPSSIRGCCDGMDVVFSSIGITRQRDGLTYMDVDYQGNVNLLKEAIRSGVSRFLYVSVFQASDIRIFRHSRFSTDYLILITHQESEQLPAESGIALNLVAGLREAGLVNHNLWIPFTEATREREE